MRVHLLTMAFLGTVLMVAIAADRERRSRIEHARMAAEPCKAFTDHWCKGADGMIHERATTAPATQEYR
ncbi:MAG TPA: hypothetical protein VH475_16470 [Tepidisphaeraceae bacterium]